MKRPTWNEVLSAPDHVVVPDARGFPRCKARAEACVALLVCAFFDRYTDPCWSEAPPDELRTFALFCILAEEGRR